MADRRKSPRLVMLDNGKEEATEDDGKEEATGVASRKGCCLAACSVVDLTSLASDLDPNAPEYLDPNATPCLRGNCSNAASKTVAERTVDAVMVGDGALSEDDDCALPTVLCPWSETGEGVPELRFVHNLVKMIVIGSCGFRAPCGPMGSNHSSV